MDDLWELGFYGLAGHSDNPRDLLDEVRSAERMGLGAAFLSERFNVKEAATLSGAAGAATERLGIATAATNHNTRHPLVTATMAALPPSARKRDATLSANAKRIRNAVSRSVTSDSRVVELL